MNVNYQNGDIVLVKFHSSAGAELKKYRPAVVINNLEAIDQRFINIAPLTTCLENAKTSEILIEKNPALKKSSLLLCWYLKTIDQQRIVKKIGQLTTVDWQKVRTSLPKLF